MSVSAMVLLALAVAGFWLVIVGGILLISRFT